MARRMCRNDDPDPFPEVLRDAFGGVGPEERLLWGSLSEKRDRSLWNGLLLLLTGSIRQLRSLRKKRQKGPI